ncbi:MAG: HAMP domain-containing histidine kinase [Anaerolineae bacterium]|nr:HAMP domain-containing histidine kinase [Anaerolineae bacterium]
MSIRLRLTLLYTVILALTLTAFGMALYNVQAQSTYHREMHALAEWVKVVVAHRSRGYGPRGPQMPLVPPFPVEESPWPRRAGARAIYTQLLDLEGRVFIRSANLEDFTLPLSSAGLFALRQGKPWVEQITIENERFLTYSMPVIIRGQVVEIVQVARSIADQERYLSTLRRNLIVGGAVAVAFAFVSGWIMAGIVLRPIHRITQTARAIGEARDLSRRVQYRGPNDELGQLATTFNTMLAQLEQAYKQQQQFVADVSHELRTPLTTLRGNLGLLRREPPISAEDRAEVLSDMEEECERLIRLVNNLLALARAEARRSFQTRPVEVGPLLEEVCRQANLLDPTRTIVCHSGVNVAVLADRDALKQVLLILLDNALKHTTDDVTVGAAVERGQVLLSVADRGPGIEAERLPHLFERFSPVKEGGCGPTTGLGLAIAKSLVEAQGGTITVESRLGEGSTFTVALPLAVGE